MAWERSRPFQNNVGIKPFKEKAGVIVYRNASDGNAEVLVITARLNRQSWIFPMGTSEYREKLEETATRECEEESGYSVELLGKIQTIELDKGESIDRLTFYLGKVVGEKESYEKDRQRKWVKLGDLAETIIEDFRPVAMSAIRKLEV